MEVQTQLQMNIPELSKTGHAYLDELEKNPYPFSHSNPYDHRKERWAEQRSVYGFDDSETWDLSSTFYAWLYEHLRMYVDIGGKAVDLDFHKFEYHGCEYTQLAIINMILERIVFYFSEEYDDWTEEHVAYINEIGELWAIVLPAMWW